MSKALGGKPILGDVEFNVPQGTIAVIEGANGAGKTTLVRILATVITPDTGTVVVNNFDTVKNSLQARRSIGVSFANERSLYWRLTGTQNLQFFGKIWGLSKRIITRRSSHLLDALDLTEIAATRVGRMSTGQRQRLLVARAMLSHPAVLLLDEPFRGLDQAGLTATLNLVQYFRSTGVTTLIAAPVIDDVLSIADSTYRISGSQVEPFQGSTTAEPRENHEP